MKFLLKIIVAGVFVMLAISACPQALCMEKTGINMKYFGEADPAHATPQIEHCAHRVGKLWMSVTNWGQFGYEGNGADFTSWDCPRSGNRGRTSFPSAEYPGGSTINYLFHGALWIGAIVDDDTLVSVGLDGWNSVYEMYPQRAPYGGLLYRSNEPSDPNYDLSSVGEFDIVAKYADTLTDEAFINRDPVDNRPHIPLGLDIVQESYSWSESEYEDFIIFKYRLKNISTHDLNKIWIGLYFDTDVWYPTAPYGYADDISGSYYIVDSLSGNQILVGWSADNDGDPTAAGLWDSQAPRGVFGVALLDSPARSEPSFNWWTSSVDYLLDWGPRRQENSRNFGTGGLGTPDGDRNKYYIMSTSERDYDQIFSTVDHSATGWLPPYSTIAADISDGCDTKFLLSFGATNLAPGDSTEFAFVVAMGDNFHRNPTDFLRLFDHDNPQPFYKSLDFSDLTTNILTARRLYRQLTVVVPGDVDRSGAVSLADAICLLNYLYLNGPAPRPLSVADLNGDCSVNFADIVYMFRYLFRNGSAPVDGCAP
jgi:hypothetical protein